MSGRYAPPAGPNRPGPVSAATATGGGPATPVSRTGAVPRVYHLTDHHVQRACQEATSVTRSRFGPGIVLEIARCTRKFGNATPSRAGLAKRLGCSERTVTRCVTALESAGVLRVVRDPPQRRRDGTYTRRRTSLYRILAPRNPCSHRRDTGVTSKPLRGCNSSSPAALTAVDNPSEPRAGPDPPPWHPSLDGRTWRDLVVRDG